MPSTATPTATSATASTAFLLWQAPGRGQREPPLLVPLGPAAVAGRDGRRYRRRPSARPSDRIRADGSIVERNTGRKDNIFSSLDLRLSREFELGRRVALEPIVEVFNLFNSKNLLVPQTTNLIFNFDGTIRARPRRPAAVAARRRLIW